MDKFFYYIDKYKFGILAALMTYAIIFTYLQLKHITQYEPIEKMFNHSKIEIPIDEITLQPENIQVSPNFSGGEIKNTTKDLNDQRQFSNDKWSRNQGNSNQKSSADNGEDYSEEKNHLEKVRKEINERNETNKKTNNTTSTNTNSNNSSSSGSNFQFKGNVLVTYDVKTRTESRLDAPGYSCKGAGKVAIKVKVDSYGTIVSAKFDSSKSSGADQCMIDLAMSFAKSRSRFTAGSGNVDGYIYYTFVAQ